MRHLFVLPALAALVAIAGCNLIPGAVGPKVKITGKLFAPAGQLSMVAAGGGNVVPTNGAGYILYAAAGEAAAGNAKLTITSHPLPTTTVPVTTGNAGEFTVELAGGVYTANTDKGGLPSLIVAGAAASSIELDAANHMVAAKMLGGVLPVDGAKLLDGIAKLRPLVKQSPASLDAAEWVKAFDATATAEVKTALGL